VSKVKTRNNIVQSRLKFLTGITCPPAVNSKSARTETNKLIDGLYKLIFTWIALNRWGWGRHQRSEEREKGKKETGKQEKKKEKKKKKECVR
jgi:hypothetical protein